MKKYLLFIVLLIVNINNTIVSSPNSSPIIDLNIAWDDIDVNWDESDINLINDLSKNFSPKSSCLKNSTLNISNSKNDYIIHDKQNYVLFKMILSSKAICLNSLLNLIQDINYPVCPEDIILFSDYVIENKNQTNELISTYIKIITQFLKIQSNSNSIYFKVLNNLKLNECIKENKESINICAKILNRLSQNTKAPLNILIELLYKDPNNQLIYINLIKYLAKEQQYINHKYGKYKQTPLILALKYNLAKAAKILIESGADTTIVDKNNRCALQFVFHVKDKQMQLSLAKTLIKKDKYNKDKYKGLLVYALNSSNTDLSKVFIEKGARIFINNKYDKASLNLFIKRLLPTFVKIYNIDEYEENKEKAINSIKKTINFMYKFNNMEIYDEKTINNLINLKSNPEMSRLLIPNYNEFKNVYERSLTIKILSYSKSTIFPPELSAKITSYIGVDQSKINVDIDTKKQS